MERCLKHRKTSLGNVRVGQSDWRNVDVPKDDRWLVQRMDGPPHEICRLVGALGSD